MKAAPNDAAAVKIREASIGDAAPLVELLTQLGYPSSLRQVRARLGRLFAQPASYVLVATLNREVIGVAALHVTPLLEHDQLAGQLIALAVDARARRRGIGRMLVESIEQEAERRGCFAVVLNSGDHREAAHDFYQALGYSLTGRRFIKRLGTDTG